MHPLRGCEICLRKASGSAALDTVRAAFCFDESGMSPVA
jgi:hypothetical protein